MKRTIYTLALGLLITGYSFGQTIDQKRMDRDLEIAENILQTLSNTEGNRFYSSNNTESSYIPDYGVILSYPGNSSKAFRAILRDDSDFIISGNATNSNVVIAPSSEGGTYSYSYSTTSDHDDDCDDCPEKVKDKLMGKEKLKEKLEKNQKEWAIKSEEIFKEQATAFLVDYADLIGQLKPSDRIMITSKSRHAFSIGALNGHPSKTSGSIAEIIKSDLVAYKKGVTSREATIKKIKFTTIDRDAKVERDLELFGSIFAKLYDSDLSNTYYTSSSRVNYEHLDNFGAIYNMRVYSSSSDNGLHTIRTTRENGLTQQERDAKVNAMYPEFERSVKENMLDYGRTIKSLNPNEILMIKIRLTTCNGCDMPRSIEASVKASVLNDYGSGKTSKESAIRAVSIKKVSN